MLRWRIAGSWFGDGTASFAKLSWNAQCSFQIGEYKGSGKGVFHRKGEYFQIRFRHKGQLHALTLSQLAYPEFKRITDGTISAEVILVEPWYCPTIFMERLSKSAEQKRAAQPATQPADKTPVKDQPSTPTSEDAPR